MTLKTRIQSQRDARWGSIFLGFNTALPYNIYNYGCLITSLANYIDKQPDEVNQLLKDNAGFVDGGNFVWSKCSVLGLTQSYVSPRYQEISLATTEVNKLVGFLDLGFPALCEVDFNPADDPEQMHFVLAVGHTDSEIIIVDPWEGQLETWSFAAFQRNTYQFRIYDKKLETGEAISLQGELDKCVNDRNSHWNFIIKIAEKLRVDTSQTIVLAEIDKLITYEDKVHQQEQQLSEVQAKAQEFATQAADKAQELVMMQKTILELQAKLDGAIKDNTTLQGAIQELKTQAVVQSTKPWYIQILEFFRK